MHAALFDIQLKHRIANGFFMFFKSIFHSYLQVEAFPEPIRYWEKIPDSRLIEQSEYDSKYNIETIHSDM